MLGDIAGVPGEDDLPLLRAPLAGPRLERHPNLRTMDTHGRVEKGIGHRPELEIGELPQVDVGVGWSMQRHVEPVAADVM